MVKQKHGGSRRGTRARPLQGILLVLVILAAAGRVVAADTGDIIEGAASIFTKVLGKTKGAEKHKPVLKGIGKGTQAHKIGKKIYHRVSGSTSVIIDTVQVPGTPVLLPVATADINAPAAVRAGSCATTTGAGVPNRGPIKLLGRQGTEPVLNPVMATFLGCPAGGTSSAVLGLGWGGDLVPRFIPTFSYSVIRRQSPDGENVYSAVAWIGPAPPGSQQGIPTPLVPVPLLQDPGNLYHVRITNIQVAHQDIMRQAPLGVGQDATAGSYVASLSTINPFTLLPPVVYNRLKAELVRILRVATAPPPLQYPDMLCYYKHSISSELMGVPAVAVIFDGGAVMQPSLANLLLSEQAQYDCLSILPTTGMPVVGSLLQSGRMMTIEVAAGGGTLTF